jgi:dipeptidyl aminopeptidase/acylaminoacyl peptidase
VGRITAPLLICHGEKDPRVPVGEARQIERALRDRSRPVETLYFADEGHGFSKRPNRVKYLRTIAKFLHERIG